MTLPSFDRKVLFRNLGKFGWAAIFGFVSSKLEIPINNLRKLKKCWREMQSGASTRWMDITNDNMQSRFNGIVYERLLSPKLKLST